jgi:O-antigen/teichoic acid export membrane protein
MMRQIVARLTDGLLSGCGWSFVLATAGYNGFNFLFHVVMSRQLGPSSYGALNALLGVMSILTVPLGAVQLAVTQAVVSSGPRAHSLRSLVCRSAVGGGVAMMALLSLCPALASYLNLHSLLSLALVGGWIPLAVVGAVVQGALLGELRFLPVAVGTFFGLGGLRLLVGVAIVRFGWGIDGAVAATLIGQAVTTAAFLVVARGSLFSGRGARIRITLSDATLSILALTGYTALTAIDTLMARHVLSRAAAGEYASAAVVGHIAMFTSGALVMVAFPRFASDAGAGASSRKTLFQALPLVTLVGVATAGVLAMFPHLVVRVLFGVAYLHAASAIGILSLASALFGVIGLFTYFHIARRSTAALINWLGVVLVIGAVTVAHGGIVTIATEILGASVLVFLAAAMPAALAIRRQVKLSRTTLGGPSAAEAEAPHSSPRVAVLPIHE